MRKLGNDKAKPKIHSLNTTHIQIKILTPASVNKEQMGVRSDNLEYTTFSQSDITIILH